MKLACIVAINVDKCFRRDSFLFRGTVDWFCSNVCGGRFALICIFVTVKLM